MSPATDRASNRVLFIWIGGNLDGPIGGLQCVDGLTNVDLLQMVSILLITSSDRVVQDAHGAVITENDDPVQPGDYIVSANTVEVNDEMVYTRASSIATGERVREFREAVQERDKRCVVSKLENLNVEYGWAGFEAAHIFPLAYEQQWHENSYGRWISMVPAQGGEINSVQNGLLLTSSLHQLFDQYFFTINPDNGFKVVLFMPADTFRIGKEKLDGRLLNHPAGPSVQLLRWHFRQAVLANMRGAGEPIFEHDFQPGGDTMGEIMQGPKPAEHMQFQLFNRLASHMETMDSSQESETSGENVEQKESPGPVCGKDVHTKEN